MTILSMIVIVACLQPCVAGSPSGEPTLNTVDTLLARQQYGEANTLLSRHLDSFPDDNKALYMLVAVEQTRILDYESYPVDGSVLSRKADSVKKILSDRLPKLTGADSLNCLYYIANINGCIGVLLAKTGELLPAMKSALESVTQLNEVTRLDSSRREAYLGIGLFHYYLSKSFTWLPFVDANSEMEGIKKVERATLAPFPDNYAARNSLSWILMDRHKHKRVDSIAGSVLAQFPDNTIFLRILCMNTLWSKRNAEAVAYGEKLAKITLNRQPVNWSDLVLAYYAICSGNELLGRKKEANAAADYILGAPLPVSFREIPHIKKNLRRIQSIRKKS